MIYQKPSSFGWMQGTLSWTRMFILWRAKSKLSSAARQSRVPIPKRELRGVGCVMMNTPSRSIALIFGYERNVCNASKTNVYS